MTNTALGLAKGCTHGPRWKLMSSLENSVFSIREVVSIVSRKNTEKSEHRDDDRAKIAAPLGQNIFVARRPFAVAAALQKTGID